MNLLQRILITPQKSAKRLQQAGYFISHLPQHSACTKVLRRARRKGLLGSDVFTAIKYLGIYLTESMSPASRREALSFHYAFLCDKVPDGQAARRWARGTTLWRLREEADGPELAIQLDVATLSPMEGESELRFLYDGKILCTLTFSFIDGMLIGLQRTPVLFVGGVQGGADCRREIRLAARANGEIAPAAMLLLAARAIAEQFGVEYVVGVSGDSHAAIAHAADKISLAYDTMWLEAGAVRTDAGVFIVVPGSEKPLSEVSQSHRARTRRKRRRKLELKQEIAEDLGRLFDRSASRAAPAAAPLLSLRPDRDRKVMP